MKSYLCLLGKEILKITQDPKRAEMGIRQAIRTASECLEDERTKEHWTQEDTYACIIGMTGNAMGLERELMRLKDFGDVFNEMLTEHYNRHSAKLLENFSRITHGVIGAFEMEKHNL